MSHAEAEGRQPADLTDQERVIAVATRLFAELGYDSTSSEILADATGTDTQTLTRETGGRRELYRIVMERAFQAEHDMVERAIATGGGRLDPHAILDVYLDFYVDNPLIVSLWMHRWMGDAADAGELEEMYVHPQVATIVEVAAVVAPPDVDVDYLVRTVVWCVFGFLSGGMPVNGRRSPTTDGPDPARLEEFRRYMHTLLKRMLTPA